MQCHSQQALDSSVLNCQMMTDEVMSCDYIALDTLIIIMKLHAQWTVQATDINNKHREKSYQKRTIWIVTFMKDHPSIVNDNKVFLNAACLPVSCLAKYALEVYALRGNIKILQDD